MVLLLDEVFTDKELRDYARGREAQRKGRPEPDANDEMTWLGYTDAAQGVTLSERVAATRNGMEL